MSKTLLSKNIENNLKNIKDRLKDCDDVIYREFLVGERHAKKFALIYVDGLIDKDIISDYVMESLMHQARELPPSPATIKNSIYDLAKNRNIAVPEIKEFDDIDNTIENILIGETVLLIDQSKKSMVISSRGWPIRGITEPQSETVIKGPRDGFVETAKVNTTLIRRRFRDPELKVKYMQLGERSKSDIALMYIEDIVDNEVLKEVKDRLTSMKIDVVLESSYVEQMIEDNWISPFPQVEVTERPDSVAASLTEGRIAIIVDNTPTVLIVPATLSMLLQSSEDYYFRWVVSSAVRILRYIAIPISLLLPSLYIAITSFHPGMLPTQLALYVAATRTGVPFPAFIEALIMEATIELLREAGTRVSGPIGTTISIVGSLVIGQAAVEAGIVSPLTIIVVALTTIASFSLPSYSFSSGFRVLRFPIMLLSSVLGLYGITLGVIIIISHLAGLKSFGVPYLAPYSSMFFMKDELKDTVIRPPLIFMRKRPKFFNIKDRTRIKK